MRYYLIFIFMFISGCTNIDLFRSRGVHEKIKVKKITEQGMNITYYSDLDEDLKINNEIKRVHKGANSFYHLEKQSVDTLSIQGSNFKEVYELKRQNYEEEYCISHREYLLMSLVAYAYFNESHINKSIYEALLGEKGKLMPKISLFSLLGIDHHWGEFIEVNKDIFSSWKIVKISDIKGHNLAGIWDDGFYAIAFSKISTIGKTRKIVIAYRGSEFFPAGEAYKDFLKTDFYIGLGSKPTQFHEGLNFYNDVVREYGYKNVSITGHSLGGGIAQYVAATSSVVHKDEHYIPRTVTYNAIGILVKNMIGLLDFIYYTRLVRFWSN